MYYTEKSTFYQFITYKLEMLLMTKRVLRNESTHFFNWDPFFDRRKISSITPVIQGIKMAGTIFFKMPDGGKGREGGKGERNAMRLASMPI